MLFRGQKVILREKKYSDSENDYMWRRDPELIVLDAAPRLKLSRREYIAYSNEEIRNPSRRRRRFAIDSLDGTHIGNCMYYDIDEINKQAELGILIGDKDYWGKGYGEDAVNTLVLHIFNTSQIKRIYLKTLDWNTRAQRCFHKCGFVNCGEVSKDSNNFIVMEIYRSWITKREIDNLSQESTSVESVT